MIYLIISTACGQITDSIEADPSEAAAGGAEDSPGAGAGPEGESAPPASASAPPDASTGKQEDGSPPFCIDLVQLE